MSVYLNKNEIDKLCEQFNGELDKYSKYVSIYLKTNDGEYTEFIQFKRRNSNDFKIIWFSDEILHDKLNNVWRLGIQDWSNYGKPITRKEFEDRLQKFTKNMEDLPLILKKQAEKLKEIRLNDDFV